MVPSKAMFLSSLKNFINFYQILSEISLAEK